MSIYPENAVIMAPLAGYTDLPYRHSLRRHECFYAFTEMVDTGSLIYARGRTRNFLDRADDEEWLGTQLVGNKIDEIEKAVEIVNEFNFNVLDLNIGCPTPKVARKGKGAGLAKDPDHAAKIIDMMVKKSKFPITAKIRIQDINDPRPTIFLAKKLELAGAQAITIHGRLEKAIYSGPCYADIIKAVKGAVNVQIIANGGVTNYEKYCDLKKKSECNEIMVARGAMGNPWIFEEIKTGVKRIISTDDLCNEMESHIFELANYYDEIIAMKLSRKIILDYLQGRGYPRELKCDVVEIKTLDEFKQFMKIVKKGPSERYLKSINKHN
jgi:tRNA-dihydrouridine synthase B